VTTDISGTLPSVTAVIVQPNGQIVVGGASGSGRRHVPSNTVLVRYNSNGSLDTTFGKGGIVRDVALHEKAIEKVRAFAGANGLEIVGVLPSHLAGAEGNLEYFLHARRKG